INILNKFVSYLYFFFQEEDGIRVRNVTGVQTCALPIYKSCVEEFEYSYTDDSGKKVKRKVKEKRVVTFNPKLQKKQVREISKLRSEERRVGRESRSRRTRKRQTERDDRTERRKS